MINDSRCVANLNDMCQASTLKNMKRMVQSLREPRAQNRDLLRVPLLEKVQNPKVVVDFASDQINVVAREINVTRAELLA